MARPPAAHDGGGPRPLNGPPELGAAVRAALGYLSDLTSPPPAVRDGRVDAMLRASLQAHEASRRDGAGGGNRRGGYTGRRGDGARGDGAHGDGVRGGVGATEDGHVRGRSHGRARMDEVAAAVRTACAHLAASELEDAYLALRTAVDRLPRPLAPRPADTATGRGTEGSGDGAG